jgi:hypothetical protein
MMISRRALMLGAVAGAAVVGGCVATAKLAPQGAFRAGRAFAVTLQRPWSDMTPVLSPRVDGLHLLTMEGPALNQLYLASIASGAPLFRKTADTDAPTVNYRADMGDTEMVEFVIDSLALSYEAPEASALRPQTLAGAPGIRFDIAMRTAAGLNMSGAGLVARAGERLNAILFLAPSEHYYGAYASEIEAIFASAQPV